MQQETLKPTNATPPALLLVTLVIEQMRYAPPRSAPGAARDGTTDKRTHICICNDGTGVCARAPHARRRGWGVGALAYDELPVKLFEALFFRAPSKGSTHACTRIQPPLHMTALPIRPFWTNTRQTAGSNILSLGRVSAVASMGDQAFIFAASIGSATGTYVRYICQCLSTTISPVVVP